MTDELLKIKASLKKQKPLIHCITNPISINQCANAILSLGARPIMAEHPEEVLNITRESDALMLNIGNITDARMESIAISLKAAKEKGIPVLLDAVGVACSMLRREYILSLLKQHTPSVIKGNYSEIKALYDTEYTSGGVDADSSINEYNITATARELAKRYKTVIMASGKTDVITDGERLIYVKNGTSGLAAVTGTGCMLGAVCTAFMTAEKPVEASAAACCYFGICGELSVTDSGYGSFMVNLMDSISTLGRDEILKYCNVEEIYEGKENNHF